MAHGSSEMTNTKDLMLHTGYIWLPFKLHETLYFCGTSAHWLHFSQALTTQPMLNLLRHVDITFNANCLGNCGVNSSPPNTFHDCDPNTLSNQLVIWRKKRRRFLWAYNLFVCIENDINENIIFFQFPWAWLTPAKGAETARASVNQTLKLSICCITRLNVTSYCERSWKVWLL